MHAVISASRRHLKKPGLILIVLVMLVSSLPAPSVIASADTLLPPPPTYIEPANGATIYPTQNQNTSASPRAIPTFRWNPVAGALAYGFELNTAQNFSGTMLIFAVVPNPAFTVTSRNLPDATMYWRVWVWNDGSGNAGDKSASPTWSFTKRWDINWNKPNLILPLDNAVMGFIDPAPLQNGGELKTMFSWTPVTGATQYRLDIATNDLFSDAVPIFTDNTSYQMDYKFPDRLYYWRVVPYQSGDPWPWVGAFSETRRVTFNYSATYIPTQLTPPNGQPVTFTPTFKWTSVRGAQIYVLQYSTDNTFPPNNLTTEILTYATSYTPQYPLENDKNYYWRVRAKSGNSDSPIWSPIWTVTKQWYDRPNLLTPTNSYTQVDTPFFSWTPVKGAAKYLIQMNPTNSFQTPEFSAETGNTFFVRWNMRCAFPVVYWQVIPIDASNNRGKPSNASQFNCAPLADDSKTAWAPVQIYPLYYYPPLPTTEMNPRVDRTVPLPVFMWKRLRWKDNVQAAAYRIQVFDKADAELLNPVWEYDTQNLSAIPADKTTLAAGTEYNWRVRPLDGLQGSEIGQWSQLWRMRFNPALIASQATSSIQLLRPAAGSEWVETVPLFEWRPLQNATGYQVQISKTADPAAFASAGNLVKDVTVGYPSYGHPDLLKAGTYYWRVIGKSGAADLGAWSAPIRFYVATQSRWRTSRTLGSNSSPSAGIDDPAGDMTDANYDLTKLAITQDLDYWYFGFNVGGTANARYAIYIDLDRVDGSGATSDARSYAVKTISANQPEYAVYVTRNNGAFATNLVTIYKWVKSGTSSYWEGPTNLSTIGGLLFSSSNYVEFRIPNTAIGMDENTGAMSAALFSLSTTSNTRPQDTVPPDPAVNFTTYNSDPGVITLSRFVAVSERLTLVYPSLKAAGDPNFLSSVAPLAWQPPVEVVECSALNRFDVVRIGVDPQLTSWIYSNLIAFPNSHTFATDLNGDNSYYWQVRQNYGCGAYYSAWSQASTFDRKGWAATGTSHTLDLSNPTFSWSFAEGADLYRLQISRDSSFSQAQMVTDLFIGQHNTFTPKDIAASLENKTTYYWRVRPVRTGTVYDAWSPTKTFVINRTPPTGLFTLPPNTQGSPASYPLTLCWQPVNFGWRYRVKYSYNVAGSTVYGELETEQSCQTPPVGTSDGEFFWQVAMRDGAGKLSEYSAMSSYVKEYPRPKLVSPLSFTPGTPIFKWTPVQGAELYQIIAYDANTMQEVINAKTYTTEYIPMISFGKTLVRFRWKVRMLDYRGNPGPYSNEAEIVRSYLINLPMMKK